MHQVRFQLSTGEFFCSLVKKQSASLLRYAWRQLALVNQIFIVNSQSLHGKDVVFGVACCPCVASTLMGRWQVEASLAVLFQQWMLGPKRLEAPGKLLASYNKCKEFVSIVLGMCRWGDIPPGLRHFLSTYPKMGQNSAEAHQNAKKQLYRCLYGILQVKQTDLHSVFTFAYICTLSCVRFGSQKKLDVGCEAHPMFVYREVLQSVVRVKYSLGVKTYNDLKGNQVTHFAVYFCIYYPHALSYTMCRFVVWQ